ncbi:pre-mRNA-processing factor 40 homolog A isoform X1 [Folsomia candida]|uniref:pre-mRNA-processing factor 40 homolog A isoform X1 n=2 Tax=Folsomia candida TaxID=158441 RepID=UPI000B909FB4|nr:pre-mRNA-processing factor 40 homolog A isoform X1 [Folsomia candida]
MSGLPPGPPMFGMPPFMPGMPLPQGIPLSIPPPTMPGFVPVATNNGASSHITCDWSDHTAPDGRTYYYNNKTKQSSWDKPEEMKSPTERLLSQCPWKEYTADTGKKYYHNINTKESKWTIPAELDEIKKQLAMETAVPSIPPTIAGAGHIPMPGLPPGMIIPQGLPPAIVMNAPPLAVSTPSSLDAAVLDETSRLSTLTDDNTKTSAGKSDESGGDSSSEDEVQEKDEIPKVKDKKEATEIFKELLREKNVHSTASWEQASKLICRDPRFKVFEKNNERKQAFNAYKIQKQKDEREDARQKVKKAKEELEKFLLENDKMTSITKYYRCEELFGTMDIWRKVPDADRRDIYEDAIQLLAKKEKEEGKTTKKRNMKKLSGLLEGMTSIIYQTTWQEAQQLLLENSAFFQDRELLAMDKEDALIVFEKHIKEQEKEEEEERGEEKKRKRRIERKNRDGFIKLLDELHDHGKLTSMSLWVELYPIISSDARFAQMLGQPGSSPLDLFKFYVEDLKSRYQDEKKIIREILRGKSFDVTEVTTFEEFATVVCEDKRAATLDAGNVKLTFNSFLEKAEAKAKEKVKEHTKKLKLLGLDLIASLKGFEVDYQTTWDDIRSKVIDTVEFKAFDSEADCQKVFEEYVHEMDETCGHHHHSTKKTKKAKKHKKRASSSDSSKSHSPVVELDESLKKKKKSKKNRKRSSSRSRSESRSSISSDSELREKSKKKKKAKKKKSKKRSSSNSSLESWVEKDTDSKKKDKNKGDLKTSSSGHRRDGSIDTNELSESELEKQRALLLQQLKYAGDNEDHR